VTVVLVYNGSINDHPCITENAMIYLTCSSQAFLQSILISLFRRDVLDVQVLFLGADPFLLFQNIEEICGCHVCNVKLIIVFKQAGGVLSINHKNVSVKKDKAFVLGHPEYFHTDRNAWFIGKCPFKS
jgi:hypothetical protein